MLKWCIDNQTFNATKRHLNKQPIDGSNVLGHQKLAIGVRNGQGRWRGQVWGGVKSFEEVHGFSWHSYRHRLVSHNHPSSLLHLQPYGYTRNKSAEILQGATIDPRNEFAEISWRGSPLPLYPCSPARGFRCGRLYPNGRLDAMYWLTVVHSGPVMDMVTVSQDGIVLS